MEPETPGPSPGNPKGRGRRVYSPDRAPPPPKPAWQRYFDDLNEPDDPVLDAEAPEPDPHPLGGLTGAEADHLRAILEELAGREQEALRLYEPMPPQEEFHASQAGERLVIGGNRGGKTLCSMVELARAITGQDPHGKYSPRDGVAIAVGKDLRHCSKVFYELLFKPGAFKVIFDPELGRKRAFRPGNDWDEEHRAEARPAPPLIPKRFYRDKDISWENKREGIIKSIKLHATGWTLNLFSSLSAPPQGWKASLVLFDEEIEHPLWYTEVSARLPDLRQDDPATGKFINGRFWWGATPQAGTTHLYDLSEKAEACKGSEYPPIEKFFVSFLNNIHLTEKAKEDLKQKLASNEDEYNVRILGHFAIAGSRVYPEFMPKGAHGCDSFEIPADWTRVIAFDPGRQVCAVLFMAIPPPHVDKVITPDGREFRVKGRRVIYDELYLKKCNATIFAERLKKKAGVHPIHDAIIDNHAGRVHEMGSGKTHEEQYSLALKKVKFRFERTGFGFTWGSDDVDSGILAVRQGFHIDGDGHTTWLVFRDRCPWLLEEAKKYVYKKVPGTGAPTDKPLDRDNHLMDCWRYLAMARCKYVKPRPRKHAKGYTCEALDRKRERARAKAKSENGGSILLG